MTPYNCEIVDCGAFCEVIFFCISPKNLLGDFFDSLGRTLHFSRASIPMGYCLVLKGECPTLWAQDAYLSKLSTLLIEMVIIYYHPWLKIWKPILQIRGTPCT